MNGRCPLLVLGCLIVFGSSASAEDMVESTQQCEKSVSQLRQRLDESVKLLAKEYKAYLKVSEKTGRSVRFDKELAKQSALLFRQLRKTMKGLSKVEQQWKKTETELARLNRQFSMRNKSFQRELGQCETSLRQSFGQLLELHGQLKDKNRSEQVKAKLRKTYQALYKRWNENKNRYQTQKRRANLQGQNWRALKDLILFMPQIAALISDAKERCDQESRYISESLTLHMDQLKLKKLDRNVNTPSAKNLSTKQDVKNLVFDAFCSVQKNLNPTLKRTERALKCLLYFLNSKPDFSKSSAQILKRNLQVLASAFEKSKAEPGSFYPHSFVDDGA